MQVSDSIGIDSSQCGNLETLLPHKIYVKSILIDFKGVFTCSILASIVTILVSIVVILTSIEPNM